MNNKRFWISILIAALLLGGCAREPSATQPTEETTRELTLGFSEYPDTHVVFLEIDQQIFPEWCKEYEKPYIDKAAVADDYLEDEDLQADVKALSRSGPISAEADILSYAWELAPVLQSHSYIPATYSPIYAAKYANGILEITYSQEITYENAAGVCWDECVYVYVSEGDGHIINLWKTWTAPNHS